jgi:hypothetical protein
MNDTGAITVSPELSESYHLWTSDEQDAVKILEEAHHPGYVFQPANGWVTFVVDDARQRPESKFVDRTTNPILHYFYDDESGWGFTLFREGKVVSKYRCEWRRKTNWFQVIDRKYRPEPFEPFVAKDKQALLVDVGRLLRPRTFQELELASAADRFAEAVGLVNYSDTSYMDVAMRWPLLQFQKKRIIQVGDSSWLGWDPL